MGEALTIAAEVLICAAVIGWAILYVNRHGKIR
jgi:archaellum component FlaF (FlaF/FlaG flagellin family)